MKLFSHEAEDLENILELLLHQKLEDTTFWYINYILLLWMSILLLVPFDLHSIDSSEEQKGEKQENMITKILNYGKEAIRTTGKCREGGAIMLSKFLTRPDIVKVRIIKPSKLIRILGRTFKKLHHRNNFRLLEILQRRRFNKLHDGNSANAFTDSRNRRENRASGDSGRSDG